MLVYSALKKSKREEEDLKQVGTCVLLADMCLLQWDSDLTNVENWEDGF